MRDADHVILRRALRVALLVPVTYFFVQVVLGLDNASLASAFACFSMLALADLGGPRKSRFIANLILGCAGIVMVSLASLLSQWQWALVIVTLIVVFAIAYSSVLRGYFAAATAAAILPWVYAATAPPDPSLTGVRALGWFIGAAVATVGSVVLWPMYLRSALRLRLGDVLEASADVLASMSDAKSRNDALNRLRDSYGALHAAYDGRIARPGAGTSRDRSLMQAIDETGRLITVLEFTHDQEPELGPIDSQLTDVARDTLRDCAEAMRTGSVEPNPAALDAQRETHADQLANWCSAKLAAGHADKVRAGAESSATIRIITLTVESMAIYVRGAMDRSRETRAVRKIRDTRSPSASGDALAVSTGTTARTNSQRSSTSTQDAVTFRGHEILQPDGRVAPLTLLARQFSLRSPWMRTAIRTSVAIALTVYIVTLLGVEHGFWVSLGALVALKFDASGTQRTAWQVLLGTILGFVVGCGLILAIGVNPIPLWILLPIVTFLAVYTPGAISLVVGQASFTLFVIVLLGITDPGRLNTAEWRLLDVLLGIGVSLLVSLFMWPHGVAPMVYRTARKAINASTTYVMAGFERIVDGPLTPLSGDAIARRSAEAVERANEAFDLAYSQQGPGLANNRSLVETINVATEINYFGEVLDGLARIGQLPESCGASGDAMLAAAHRVGTRIIAIVNAAEAPVSAGDNTPVIDQHHASLKRLRAAIDYDLAHLDPSGAVTAPTAGPTVHVDAGHTAMVLVFGLAWIAQSVWLADRLAAVVAGLEEPQLNEVLPMA